MLHTVSRYGDSVVAVFEDEQVIATCRPGWEDTSDWAAFVADIGQLGYEGWLSFDADHYFVNKDGSETYVIPRQQ